MREPSAANSPVVLIHIAKTAGTSLRTDLDRMYSPRTLIVQPTLCQGLSTSKSCTATALAGLLSLKIQHTQLCFGALYTKGRAQHITILRSPRSHVLSQYLQASQRAVRKLCASCMLSCGLGISCEASMQSLVTILGHHLYNSSCARPLVAVPLQLVGSAGDEKYRVPAQLDQLYGGFRKLGEGVCGRCDTALLLSLLCTGTQDVPSYTPQAGVSGRPVTSIATIPSTS